MRIESIDTVSLPLLFSPPICFYLRKVTHTHGKSCQQDDRVPSAPMLQALLPLSSQFLCVCVWRLLDGCRLSDTPLLSSGGLCRLLLNLCWLITALTNRMPQT